MIRNLSCFVTRHFPRAFTRRPDGYVRANPVYVAGVFVSSSCVHRRRYKYGEPENLDSSKTGRTLIETGDDEEGEHNSSVTAKKQLQERIVDDEEYLSDESDSDESESEALLQNLNVNFVILRRGSLAARKEVEKCLMETSMNNKKLLVKKCGNVKELINQGVKPEKIFFTILNDLLHFNVSLNGIELYKIHPTDAPPEMQRKRRAPCFAVFRKDDIKEESSKTGLLPLTIVCDRLHKRDTSKKIFAAALTSGCQRIFFTPECKTFMKAADSARTGSFKSGLSVELNQSWDQIRQNLTFNADVLVLTSEKHDARLLTGKTSIPTVNLNDLDAWTSDNGIVLICADYLGNEAIDFCLERNGREIVIPGAVDQFYKSFMSLGAITMELKKQWEARDKTKKKKKRSKKTTEE